MFVVQIKRVDLPSARGACGAVVNMNMVAQSWKKEKMNEGYSEMSQSALMSKHSGDASTFRAKGFELLPCHIIIATRELIG